MDAPYPLHAIGSPRSCADPLPRSGTPWSFTCGVLRTLGTLSAQAVLLLLGRCRFACCFCSSRLLAAVFLGHLSSRVASGALHPSFRCRNCALHSTSLFLFPLSRCLPLVRRVPNPTAGIDDSPLCTRLCILSFALRCVRICAFLFAHCGVRSSASYGSLLALSIYGSQLALGHVKEVEHRACPPFRRPL